MTTCPKCREGVCHTCGQERRDAVLAPHMGVVLCQPCFMATLSEPPTTASQPEPAGGSDE